MDESVEPVIALLGHPIAGNPAPLALSRAIAALGLDCRLHSFDVTPDDLPTALSGLRVLGFTGVWLDDRLSPHAGRWDSIQENDPHHGGEPANVQPPGPDSHANNSGPEDKAGTEQPPSDAIDIDAITDQATRSIATRCDCLWRCDDTPDQLVGANRKRLFFRECMAVALRQCDDAANSIWVIHHHQRHLDDPASNQRLPQSRVIVLPDWSSTGDAIVSRLNADAWPEPTEPTVVFDLSRQGHPESDTLRKRGYELIGWTEALVGSLNACLQIWTGRQGSSEIMFEAIEEYLGV
ncbi:hypothetical protein [Crateriforma conspicua]|uniref:Uncharacterized protein n=1 Tax=Crateriforma conspicua TaxID=2527996 RepID=A0A5C5XRW7_9PLAN|nr:hypothetical protein [Crateriforma conspicua]TWT65590.1 hypothetical protein Pan14r_51370 [Crateriforma conspicua]